MAQPVKRPAAAKPEPEWKVLVDLTRHTMDWDGEDERVITEPEPDTEDDGQPGRVLRLDRIFCCGHTYRVWLVLHRGAADLPLLDGQEFLYFENRTCGEYSFSLDGSDDEDEVVAGFFRPGNSTYRIESSELFDGSSFSLRIERQVKA